jgi:hypothetical protein
MLDEGRAISRESDRHASECSGCHRVADADQAGGELMEPVLAGDDGAFWH